MNPRHLSWKTRVANMADAISHGTWLHGEAVHSAKLTEADVREIRRLAGQVTQRELGRRFGIRQDAVSKIVNRKLWAWLE